MKIIVSIHARATGEERQAYTFETEYDITGTMSIKQQELFYFFIQGFIAGAFKRYTNEYGGLFIFDVKEGIAPTYIGKIENFEVEKGDYKL